MDEDERDRIRIKRREYHFILQLCDSLKFESVKQTEIEQITKGFCFGSKRDREILPTASSYFTIKESPEIEEEEEKILKPSWVFSSQVPRFPENNGDKLDYNFYNIKEPKKPFGFISKIEKDPDKKDEQIPGPGAYKPRSISTNFNRTHSLGGKTKLVPAVFTICTVFNEGDCNMCGKLSSGDYWRSFELNQNLCESCYQSERKKTIKISRIGKKLQKMFDLQTFKKARYCGFYHTHLATEAAVKHSEDDFIKKKLFRENYLARYWIKV